MSCDCGFSVAPTVGLIIEPAGRMFLFELDTSEPPPANWDSHRKSYCYCLCPEILVKLIIYVGLTLKSLESIHISFFIYLTCLNYVCGCGSGEFMIFLFEVQGTKLNGPRSCRRLLFFFFFFGASFDSQTERAQCYEFVFKMNTNRFDLTYGVSNHTGAQL